MRPSCTAADGGARRARAGHGRVRRADPAGRGRAGRRRGVGQGLEGRRDRRRRSSNSSRTRSTGVKPGQVDDRRGGARWRRAGSRGLADVEPAPCRTMAARSRADRAPRPIAVFDSGVGGLTVLHELLVALPARGLPLPRRHRALPLRRAAARASSSASRSRSPRSCWRARRQAARRRVQLGDGRRAAGAAASACSRRRSASTCSASCGPRRCRRSTATRNGRIGLLATPATVASGAYARRDRARSTRTSTCRSVACPDLAPIIQAGFPFDERVVDAVRRYVAPLREAGVDTVILGCTHYPLVRPMLQRMLGRGVRSSPPGAALARQVEHALGVARPGEPRAGEGDLPLPRAPATPRRSARSGTRFLQMPLGEVEHASRPPTERGARDEPSMTQRRPQRRGRSCARSTIEPGFVRTATGSALISLRRDARDLHRLGRGERAALAARAAGRGWVTAEYGMLPGVDRASASSATSRKGAPDGRTRRDPAPDRPLAARRRRLRGARRAHDLPRLRRAAGRRRHALRLDHRRLRRARARAASGWSREGALERVAADAARSPPSRAGSSTARRCSTSTTPRTRPPRSTRTSS